ncbi:MAG: FtsW/RodA/SpoVE family cell cycle protein [Oscillibacter sp.]
MTKEERLLRQEQRERAKAIEAAAREAGRGPLDLPYLLLVLTLVGVGLIMLFSASFPSAYYEEGNPAYYLIRQGIFAILGITAMFIVGKINYERYRAVAKMLLIFSIILLVLVLIPGIGTGRLTHGAQRWIRLGPIQFQPSEITKVGIILYCRQHFEEERQNGHAALRHRAPMFAILGVIAALMAKSPLFRYGAAARHRCGDDVRRRYPQLLGRSRLCAGAAGDLRLCDRHHHLQLEPNRHLA